jgi:hypothetical protein
MYVHHGPFKRKNAFDENKVKLYNFFVVENIMLKSNLRPNFEQSPNPEF